MMVFSRTIVRFWSILGTNKIRVLLAFFSFFFSFPFFFGGCFNNFLFCGMGLAYGHGKGNGYRYL